MTVRHRRIILCATVQSRPVLRQVYQSCLLCVLGSEINSQLDIFLVSLGCCSRLGIPRERQAGDSTRFVSSNQRRISGVSTHTYMFTYKHQRGSHYHLTSIRRGALCFLGGKRIRCEETQEVRTFRDL